MTTNPTKTRLTKIAERRAEDRASARAANHLDQRAEEVMRADPHLAPDLAEVLAEVATRARLRGLFQHALRRFARIHARTSEAARKALALHRQADGLYWGMVLGWTRLIERDAGFYSGVWGIEYDEARSRLLLSWYEAALRYDPDRKRAFSHFAFLGVWAKYPEAGPLKPLVHASNAVYENYTLIYLEDVAPDPDPDGDEIDLLDRVLVDDAPSPLDEVSGRQILDLVRDCLPVLSSRERFVLDQRHMEGDLTLLDLGKQMRLSRERVRQIERGAIWKLRDALHARGITGHAARS